MAQKAIPVYTEGMAKVMISMPDETLKRLDELAGSNGKTRSGLLRDLVERELESEQQLRGQAIDRIIAMARPAGGKGTQLIRDMRDSR